MAAYPPRSPTQRLESVGTAQHARRLRGAWPSVSCRQGQTSLWASVPETRMTKPKWQVISGQLTVHHIGCCLGCLCAYVDPDRHELQPGLLGQGHRLERSEALAHVWVPAVAVARRPEPGRAAGSVPDIVWVRHNRGAVEADGAQPAFEQQALRHVLPQVQALPAAPLPWLKKRFCGRRFPWLARV